MGFNNLFVAQRNSRRNKCRLNIIAKRIFRLYEYFLMIAGGVLFNRFSLNGSIDYQTHYDLDNVMVLFCLFLRLVILLWE